MRMFVAALYTALALGANAAMAEDVASLRTGDMKKLALHEAPVGIAPVELLTMEDAPASLTDYRGKWVVLNFWATWCAPCRAEMPSLARLQADMPGLVVLPVATGRNEPAAIRRFYDEAGLSNLPTLRDPKSALSRQMGVMGLPVTVILNPEGEEVARLIGDAEWDSDSAKAVLSALTANH
ncbi:TlpA family protein disulfide reductase [Xinfangfangia sp. D13-10-4-6]|uniref:TlpA family protein disulfide reductase n=1 Tax=Pseudogemmobacter hezensis TaxID=2737662 RepID=UPI001557FE56|nr:TlpA disulfide reductase family protein [Pseudogemmobacter hezensis]NPD14253.1 TlpA family protein disulfide reductase [Pseudogemmobacter hezensis]